MNKCDKLLIPAFQPMTVYLSISTTPKGTKGMQNGRWQPCRISLSAKSGCFLSLLSLDVFMQGWEFATMKRVGGELSEWPPQEGSIKSKKRERAQGMDEPEGGSRVKGGEGAPLPGPRHPGWQSPSWLQTAFVKEGKRGSLLHLGMGQWMFCQSGRGCSWGSMEGCWKRNKAKDPSSQGVGWWQWAALWNWTDVEMRMIY